MPSIKEASGADLTGYESIPAPKVPVIPSMITTQFKANPSRRCVLPSFNSDPDSLRQFETGTQSPHIRIIPLPEVNNTPAPTRATVAASTSSSSSSTNVTTSLKAVSVTISTGPLAAGASFTGSVQMQKSFQLLSLTSSALSEVRLYGTKASQSFDNSRVTDAPVPAEISQNIVSCVVFDAMPFSWPWQNKIAANQDTPQSSTVYVSVFNTDVIAVTSITVTISYLPLES